jgi:hypothetical protein
MRLCARVIVHKPGRVVMAEFRSTSDQHIAGILLHDDTRFLPWWPPAGFPQGPEGEANPAHQGKADEPIENQDREWNLSPEMQFNSRPADEGA